MAGLVIGALGILGVAGVAFAVDELRTADRVARNVSVGGPHRVGGAGRRGGGRCCRREGAGRRRNGKWLEVKANGQDTQPNGGCTRYITKRPRTFLDGRVANDFTKAQYRRREGQALRLMRGVAHDHDPRQGLLSRRT